MSLSNGSGVDVSESIALSVIKFTKELSPFKSFEPSSSLDVVLGNISHLCHQTEVAPDIEEAVSANCLIRFVKTLKHPRFSMMKG